MPSPQTGNFVESESCLPLDKKQNSDHQHLNEQTTGTTVCEKATEQICLSNWLTNDFSMPSRLIPEQGELYYVFNYKSLLVEYY